ncbi:hypothetical protein L0Z72_14260, partial [candidate division KSB1 bacterium]|nr:hypothetical protein [candidate division KSB1 bacterium]
LLTLIQENPIEIFQDYRFWVLLAMLIYSAGNLFTFALSSYIIVWSLHNMLNIIANLCYAGGFRWHHR